MPAGMPVSVVIADDHAVVRAAIRGSLEADGFNVCGEAGDAARAVALAEQHRPDACLLDVDMPGGGIHAAEQIASRCPETAIVMLTGSRDDGDLFAALRAGAAGYLLKDTDPKRLPHAIRGVLSGEAAIPRDLVSRLIDEFRTGGARRRVPLAGQRGAELTSREWEVLELMADGDSTAAMAQRLSVSPVTVRRHVSTILRKLEVSDREAAVRLLQAAEL
jgi:DNA-binding NarL/FixJ family response regulator